MLQHPSKTAWYKRPWLLILLSSNIAGLLLFCGCFPVSRQFLEAAFPYSAFGYSTGDFVALTSIVLGMIVGPAVVSATAKRYYALWGLLPLPLFSVWFLVAAIVADVPIDLDGSVILSTPLICWAVSSCPISLIRYYYLRFHKVLTPTADPASKPLIQHWLATTCIAGPIIALVVLGWYNLKHPASFATNVHTSWHHGEEARIPLIINGKRILIEAWLNGKEEVCQLDTGMNTVEWSRRLHVHGNLTSEYGQSCDPTGGCVASQTIVLPRVRIGSYEVTGLPTDALGIDLNPLSVFQPTGSDPQVILGNAAFVQTVLTIDYRNKELTIRPTKYDFMQQQRRAGNRVLQMRWTTDYPNKDWKSKLYGYPALRVALARASFLCTLDTGWDGPELGLTEDFVKHHPSARHNKRDSILFGAMHSSAQVERLHGLNVTLPCSWPPHAHPISMKVDGLVTPTLYGGDGVIGLALMERYRITIDYGRRRVLLEPYA